MTSYVFAPSAIAAYEFQPTLDGQVYTCVVTWNLAGQRWYITCSTLDGTLVFSLPVTNVNLAAGYFTTSTLVWDPASNSFVVTP